MSNVMFFRNLFRELSIIKRPFRENEVDNYSVSECNIHGAIRHLLVYFTFYFITKPSMMI